MIRERLAFTFFERLGHARPRASPIAGCSSTTSTRACTRSPRRSTAPFVQRVTGETGGTVFEFHYSSARPGAPRTSAPSRTTSRCSSRGRTCSTPTPRSTRPIQQLFREVNGPDDAVWLERVGQYIDLEAVHDPRRHRAVHRRERRDPRLCRHEQLLPVSLARHEQAPAVRLGQGPVVPVRRQPDRHHRRQRPVQPRHGLSGAAGDVSADDRAVRPARRKPTTGWCSKSIGWPALVFDAARADTKKQFSNEQFDEAVAVPARIRRPAPPAGPRPKWRAFARAHKVTIGGCDRSSVSSSTPS